MNALRNALMLAILFGAGLTITPPAPVAANDCDSTIDCLIDTVPVPPGPCGIIQIESCRCLTHVGACGIEVPDPCDMGDCGCVTPQHVNSDDLRVCGFSVNPCDWLEGANNLCACVNVPTTTTFGRAPSGSGSCGIALPGPGGQPPGPVPNPCDGLPEDTCECISISNTLPGVALSAVPDYVCGIPTNPCALVGTGTLADGCGCVEMNGPQRLSLAGLFATTSITSTGIIPTSICGIPTDPCATSAGAMACECIAQIEREVLQGGGGGGMTLGPLAFQRIVTPPALCVSMQPPYDCETNPAPVPADPTPYNWPAFDWELVRVDPGYSRFVLYGFSWIERPDGADLPLNCVSVVPVLYRDSGLPSQGLGSTAVAHREHWGGQECVHEPAMPAGYYYNAGGIRGRLISHTYSGVAESTGFSALGQSSVMGYYNDVFYEKTWPYGEYRDNHISDEMLLSTCQRMLGTAQDVANNELNAKFTAGTPTPVDVIGAPNKAKATVCYDTSTLAPGVPVQVCASSLGRLHTVLSTTWSASFESPLLRGDMGLTPFVP